MKPNILGVKWQFHQLWNTAMDSLPQKPLVKREHIWASELYRPYIDRYLKMHAVAYSNPPNARSLRKFCSGHIWEWIISLILTMCGVMKEKQLRGEVQLPGLLRVTGKMDFVAGGEIDWEKVEAEIATIQKLFQLAIDDMPPFIAHAINHIIPSMKQKFGSNKLLECVAETKAISTFMMAKVQKTQKPLIHNAMQTYHYVLGNPKDILYGKIWYICKDDNIMEEFEIENSKELTKLYRTDVKEMTDIFNASNKKNPMKTLPLPENEVEFDTDLYKFTLNRMGVEWSPYLELIYGYKTPEEFRMRFQKLVTQFNRTFKRCVTGAPLTKLDKEIKPQGEEMFPEWDKYVQQAKKEGAFLKAEEVEEEE